MIEAVDLGTENDERMARLREALALGDGFQLVIVQVEPGEQREEVLRRLAGWSGRNGVPALELVRLAPGESPVMRLVGEHSGIVLVGLEADGADRDERTRAMLVELNWSRDRLPEMIRGPLVLVVSQRVQTALFEQAPDFYSWRTHSTSIALVARVLDRPLRWFEIDPEDPAVLEAMIAETMLLHPAPYRELGNLGMRLAGAHLARGEHTSAQAALDFAYDAYEPTGTTDDRMDLLILRSDIAQLLGNRDEASRWLERARHEAQSGRPSSRATTKLLFQEAMLAVERGDVESAAKALPPAIDACRRLGDQDMEARLLIGQAWLDYQRRGVEDARLLALAVELLHRTGRRASEAGALALLASAVARAGRSEEAEQYGRDAIARAEDSGSSNAIAQARATLGRIASRHGHLELADEVLRDDVAAVNSYASGQLAEARASLALRRGEDAEAERHLRAALEAYRHEGSTSHLARVSLDLAGVGRRTQQWTLALTALETADRLGNDQQRAAAAFERADLGLARGEWTVATADQFVVASQVLAAAGEAALADLARENRGIILMALDRDPEARAELEAALSGYEARGQSKDAGRVRDLLMHIGDHRG